MSNFSWALEKHPGPGPCVSPASWKKAPSLSPCSCQAVMADRHQKLLARVAATEKASNGRSQFTGQNCSFCANFHIQREEVWTGVPAPIGYCFSSTASPLGRRRKENRERKRRKNREKEKEKEGRQASIH